MLKKSIGSDGAIEYKEYLSPLERTKLVGLCIVLLLGILVILNLDVIPIYIIWNWRCFDYGLPKIDLYQAFCLSWFFGPIDLVTFGIPIWLVRSILSRETRNPQA